MDQHQIQAEALSKARSGQSFANYPAIILGFKDKGIDPQDVLPRENVFTYHAWRALGRQVRKGEHGVQCVTFVPMTKKTGDVDAETGEDKRDSFKRARSVTVFHVSQTEPVQS